MEKEKKFPLYEVMSMIAAALMMVIAFRILHSAGQTLTGVCILLGAVVIVMAVGHIFSDDAYWSETLDEQDEPADQGEN